MVAEVDPRELAMVIVCYGGTCRTSVPSLEKLKVALLETEGPSRFVVQQQFFEEFQQEKNQQRSYCLAYKIQRHRHQNVTTM